jgi:hypothetical protein
MLPVIGFFEVRIPLQTLLIEFEEAARFAVADLAVADRDFDRVA